MISIESITKAVMTDGKVDHVKCTQMVSELAAAQTLARSLKKDSTPKAKKFFNASIVGLSLFGVNVTAKSDHAIWDGELTGHVMISTDGSYNYNVKVGNKVLNCNIQRGKFTGLVGADRYKLGEKCDD